MIQDSHCARPIMKIHSQSQSPRYFIDFAVIFNRILDTISEHFCYSFYLYFGYYVWDFYYSF